MKWNMSSSLPSVGFNALAADWGADMFAYCTAAPAVHYCMQDAMDG